MYRMHQNLKNNIGDICRVSLVSMELNRKITESSFYCNICFYKEKERSWKVKWYEEKQRDSIEWAQ